MSDNVETILQNLKEHGVEIDELAHIQALVESTRQPIHKRALSLLKHNWKRVKGEVTESKELSHILKKIRTDGLKSLSPEERLFAKKQLNDFFRIFPAGLITGLNAVLPIPGTSFVTPWILKKMGLLPSRWREANLLKSLQETQQKLRAQGKENLAQSLQEVHNKLEEEAQQRTICDLLVVWDKNQNGVWDPEEEEAYHNEVAKVKDFFRDFADQRDWFLLQDGLVFGPSPVSGLKEPSKDILVRYQDQSEWVRLRDIL